MPKLLDDNMQNINANSNYSFSAVKIDSLGATEYTLVTIVVDKSGSLNGQELALEKMLKETVSSCQKSPRSDNLLLRVVYFNSKDEEQHGFKLLSQVDVNSYDNTIHTGGTTSLYDTTYQAVNSTSVYAKTLLDQDFITNSVIFIITDGMDVGSSQTANSVADIIKKVKSSEVLESCSVILIGMTDDPFSTRALQDFKNDANLDQYVEMGDVTVSKLAKLASFISRSISSSSTSLGTGGASQPLTF